MRKPLASLILAAALAAGPSLAKDKQDRTKDTPDAFKQLVQCRQIADNALRLACYDRQAASIELAQSQGDLVIADRQQMKEAQRNLFGYSIPKSALLGTDKGEQLTQVDAVIASARAGSKGGWRLVMEDGSVWDQTDTEVLPVDPRKGDKVVIKRAALGSYLVRIDGQPPIKVRRIQ